MPSSNFAAKYLLRLHRHHGAKEVLQRSARFPVCTLAVVKEIERIWKRSSSRDLLCEELPRRLFRQYTKDNLPLLRHLLDSHNASPNSHKGYPLCRAVLVQDYDLIALLLSYGADPGIKLSLPIQVAISLKDLKAVRMLIDGIPDPRDGEETRVKRQRKGNHVIVTPLLVECALNKGSKEIVEYFVKEKGKFDDQGCMPDLRCDAKITFHSQIRQIITVPMPVIFIILLRPNPPSSSP